MKKYILVLISMTFFTACADKPKEFSNISPGMTKQEVLQKVGEPSKKNDLLLAELWVYNDANRTIVFRKDTVYEILTSTEARIDSIKTSLKETGKDVKQKLENTGDTIDSASLRIKNKIMGDSVKRN